MTETPTITREPVRNPARPGTRNSETDRQPLTPWNVVLLDDQDHTYDYVIDMLGRIFGYDIPTGFRLATQVDTRGRAVVATLHRELAELRVQQIRGFGADPHLARSNGPMYAVIEPGEGGSADDGPDDHDY
ncbi:MAG: ATP-dependent Clp protease adaptor ClpS [Planctomycetota bacterium]